MRASSVQVLLTDRHMQKIRKKGGENSRKYLGKRLAMVSGTADVEERLHRQYGINRNTTNPARRRPVVKIRDIGALSVASFS